MIHDLKPYPAHKDSGVPWLGEVPDHWEVSRLKSRLLRCDAGVWGDQFDNGGTVVLRSTEQTIDGGWRIASPARIRLSPSQRAAAMLAAGDLVVTKSSGSPAHIGKTSLVSPDVAALNCCFSNFMQRLRVNRATSPDLVWRNLNSSVGREQLVFQSTTTTGLGNLNGTILGNCRFAFPPLPEQAAIVRFLDHADRRIRRYIRAKQKLIALLNEQKQAIIHRAVTRGLDPNARLKPSGVEWLGEVPEHWGVVRLKFVAAKLVDCLHATPKYSENGEFPAIRTADISPGTVRLSSARRIESDEYARWIERLEPKPGDILYSREGERFGIAACVPEDVRLCISQRMMVFRIRPDYNPVFVMWLLNSNQIYAQACQDVMGATAPHVNVSTIRNYSLALPARDEQDSLVAEIENLTSGFSSAIANAASEVSLLREYRTRLIADVVTGKLDVREAAARLSDEEKSEELEGAEGLAEEEEGESPAEEAPADE